MKFAVSQIRKYKDGFPFETDFDITKEIQRVDLIGQNKCHIKGLIFEPKRDFFLVRLSFDLELVMACAVSLEEVIVSLQFDQDVTYTYDPDPEGDDYEIVRDTLDLDQAFITEIVLNLPYRVVKEGYEDYFPEEEF